MTQQLEILNEIAINIFKANDFNEMSSKVMELLPQFIFHEKSFFTFSAIGSYRRRTNIRSLTITKEQLADYIDRFEDTDYTGWYLNQENVNVYRDSQIITPEIMRQTDIYKEWIRPMEMHYLCGNVIRNPKTHIRYGELTLLRGEEYGDFSDDELLLLSLVTDQMRAWCVKHYEEAYAKAASEANLSNGGEADPELELLTRREKDVANLIISGMDTRQVCEHLSISYGTARRHVANIYRKLGVSSRVQLVRKLRK